ncbi:MAG: CheR family methyltransferase [Methylococcaceae bacterium]|jgi:two-component system CheB/CheR fusion protein
MKNSSLRTKPMSMPVVAIGASAGGVEALVHLISALKVDAPQAFLVLLHSLPNHETMLSTILAGKTTMPVSQGQTGEPLQPGHIYILSPSLAVSGTTDRPILSARENAERTEKPIDLLFRSVAATVGQNSIGIILSGTGSDGAEGMEAIRVAGGMTLVQRLETAAYQDMPRHAAAKVAPDAVMDIDAMAARMTAPAEAKALTVMGNLTTEPALLNDDDFMRLCHILRAATGIDLSHYKRSTIQRRLLRRLGNTRCNQIHDYIESLADDQAEAQALCQDFFIGVTRFFREKDMYEGLAETVFPSLLAHYVGDQPIRIWVPGCSTGAEVYSIAMLLLEQLGERAQEITLFGTDINDSAITQARTGFYRSTHLEGVSQQRLDRFFIPVDNGYRIKPEIRLLCVFAQHDLTSDPPFSKVDLISCCNLMIYFDSVLHRRVTTTFHYALKPGGYLVLGPSESVSQYSLNLFDQIDKRRRIYMRKNENSRLWVDSCQVKGLSKPASTDKSSGILINARHTAAMENYLNRLLIDRYAPAGMVVDEHHNILQFIGRISPLLDIRPGPASMTVQGMFCPALHIALTTAIHEARNSSAPVRREKLSIDINDLTYVLDIEVVPLTEANEAGECWLITLNDRSAHSEPSRGLGSLLHRWLGHRTAEPKDVEKLRRELTATQEHLRSLFEAYEGSREDLKSTQEELLSAKEEFQSTNEELETAKEELQSANEELITANEELILRNNELSRAMTDAQATDDYAQAIVDTAHSAMVVIDQNHRIRRCNPSFTSMFHLVAGQIEGQNLMDIGEGVWSTPAFETLLKSILENETGINNLELVFNFPRTGEQVLLMNARKLIGDSSKVGLALLTLLDVSENRKAEALAKQQADLLEQAHEAILIWSIGGGIRYWNRGAEELYGWRAAEVIGRRSQDLLGCKRHVTSDEFERRLREDRRWMGEVTHLTRDGRELVVDCRYQVSEHLDGSLLVLETNHDITDRKRIEASLRQADRQKDDFIAMLAHELRNPLAPLRNALGILQRAKPGEVALPDIWNMMDRQVTKLTRMVDDLLDIARVTRNQIDLRRGPVDMVAMVHASVLSCQSALQSAGHELTLTLPDHPVIIHADSVRIEQIIENLLNNAIKYTPSFGHIAINLRAHGEMAILKVKDDGQGIAPDLLPNIFKLFMQADRTLDRRQGGLGIGLTLVRRLVNLHGGAIAAESAGIGFGSEFSVSFPLAVKSAQTEGSSPAPKAGAATTETTGSGLRVLVVDDNADIANSEAMLIESCGYEARLAYDALSALDIAANYKPELILLDIGLPDMDGYELARQLRGLSGLEAVCLAAVSGYGSEADRRASKAAGIDYHFVKPLDIDALKSLLEQTARPVAPSPGE